MGFTENDSKDNVIKNRQLFCESFGIELENMIFSRQKHTGNIIYVSRSEKSRGLYDKSTAILNNDGYVFTEKNICPVVLTADCASVFLYEYKKKIASILHCGWRGIINDIIKNSIKLIENLGGDRNNICVAISPAASRCCYEIGNDVFKLSYEKFDKNIDKFIEIRNEKYFLDIPDTIIQYLLKEKITENNIQKASICTICNPELFFSARASNGNTGRMASGILII